MYNLETIGLKSLNELPPILNRAFKYYNLENIIHFSILPLGFGGCSIKISTTKNDYVLKIFNKRMLIGEISKYAKIVETALNNKISHPLMVHALDENVIYYDAESVLYLCVFEFVQGETVYDSNVLSDESFDKIIKEVVKIHKLDMPVAIKEDFWQVTNIEGLLDKTSHVLNPSVINKINIVITDYNHIIKKLPRCFVHGDVTKTNIIVNNKTGKVWILDFGSSGMYPRIHELSIIAAHLLADGKKSLEKCINQTVESYVNSGGYLSEFEMKSVMCYTQAVIATKYLCNVYKINKNNETKEMHFWRDISLAYLMHPTSILMQKYNKTKYRNTYSSRKWYDTDSTKV